MKTYIVAGGAGFIGSHLCETLLKKGNKVICIDNLITGEEGNISHLFENKNFTFSNQNIIVGNFKFNDHIDGIFHLASPASPNAKSRRSFIAYPVETLLVNSQGTKNLLDLAVEKNSRFLFASSSEVYGDPAVSPQTEKYFGNVNPVGVRSVYDEGKRFGEAICMAYKRKYNLNVRIIRIFNTYGEKMQKDDGRVVSNFITQALANEPMTIYGEGSQTRSFCYIDDMVSGLISAIEEDSTNGQVINVGNPEEHTILELAEKIKKITSSSSKIIHEELPEDDPKKRKPDIALAKKLFNFDPQITLDEGLKKTVEYFKTI
jgi:nucleoside-diphosphate-sugar epimerase